MMSRSQITVDPEMQRRARERAAQLGISLAEYVRRLLLRDLGEPEQPADPRIVYDLGDSGGSDVARDKDALVGQAIAKERQKRRARR